MMTFFAGIAVGTVGAWLLMRATMDDLEAQLEVRGYLLEAEVKRCKALEEHLAEGRQA